MLLGIDYTRYFLNAGDYLLIGLIKEVHKEYL